MNPLRWIDAQALRAADAIVSAAWYWVKIPRIMIIRICMVLWLALQVIRFAWIHGYPDPIGVAFVPIIFIMSIVEERRMMKVPLDRRNGYILFLRERRFGFRLVIAAVLIFGALVEVSEPYPAVSLISDLFFWLYVYLNEALFPMGKPRRKVAKAGATTTVPAIHVPGW